MKNRNQLLRARVLLASFLTAFCLSSTSRVHAIAGLEGTFEFGLDAPWRIEPNKKAGGGLEYGAIPIQISIHGAMDAGLDDIIYATVPPNKIPIHLPANVVSLGKFYSVRVKELGPVERPPIEFSPQHLHEIELMVGAWPYPHNVTAFPQYRLCRLWKGENPEAFRDLSNTSEWHGSLWYVPYTKDPGASIALQIEVILERDDWPAIQLPQGLSVDLDVNRFITLRNFVRVYLAPEPLPRFDNRWVYGDFHYHSQGTDNEGEAGYNYRGVIRAMGAMGMDFLFATEHASSSEQVIDADLPQIDKIVETAHDQGDMLKEENVRSQGGVLRDMNEARFAFAHGVINGQTGVNREATLRASSFRFPQNYQSYGVMPQIFLGGEVDVVPEVKRSVVDSFVPFGNITLGLPFGDGLVYDLAKLCRPQGCDDPRGTLLRHGDSESYLVRDFQSLDSFDYFGRLHMVYFPSTSSLNVGNESVFVPSYTSRFGGATRRLDRPFEPRPEFAVEPLLPEIERKGVVFVAHHLAGGSSRGPDLIPWTTDHMLLRAFKSPAVLGLEFWNEDTRYRTRVCSHEYCRPNGGDLGVFLGQEHGYERNEKLNADSSNPFESLIIAVVEGFTSIDLLPDEFHKIALPLEEARRGFITGGSAGSLFELIPFDVVNGLWQQDTEETERALHHGAYDWDLMNLRGLAFEENADITAPRGWLQPGEPRRFFMGGGSDAHGDLNYRRAGYFLGTDDANDTAIGKPRNLVFAGAPTGPVIYHEDPAVVDIPIGQNSLTPSGKLVAKATVVTSPTRAQLTSFIKLPPDTGILLPPTDTIVKDPIVKDPIVKDPIVKDPIVVDPVRPPVVIPPDVVGPIGPIVDPGDPTPPVVTPPDVVGPIDNPVVDPGPSTPPVVKPPDVIGPIKDPILDPGTTPPPVKPPDVIGPIGDPILDPGDPTPPVVNPPHNPIDDAANLGLNIRAHTQEQIVTALKTGRFCVTDGPAIRIAIDRNGNNKIDDSDVQMGGVLRLVKGQGAGPLEPGAKTVTLLTEVISTSEFGPIMDIDVYVGVQPSPGASKPVEPRLYAPLKHGPGGFGKDAIESPQRAYPSHDRIYVRQPDRYWNGEFLGDTLTWNQIPGDPLRFSHTLVTTLDLDKYEVGEGVTSDRFFVRAFTRTAGDATRHIPGRYAYANPIWILRTEPQLAPPTDTVTQPPTTQPPAGTDGTPVTDPALPKPVLNATRLANGVVLLNFVGTLQQTADLGQPFQDIPAAASPFVVPADRSSNFFRVRQ